MGPPINLTFTLKNNFSLDQIVGTFVLVISILAVTDSKNEIAGGISLTDELCLTTPGKVLVPGNTASPCSELVTLQHRISNRARLQCTVSNGCILHYVTPCRPL